MSKFTNENRSRFYGLRIGDAIIPNMPDGKEFFKGKAMVIGYSSLDNNSVMIQFEDGTITKWVAEWCDIITKVEDII